MEDHFATLSRIDFTWGRGKKRLKVKREPVPLDDSPSHLMSYIPAEVTLHIISFLNAFDVLSLGSCSKYLNQLCESDCLWEKLYLKRWPNHLEAGSQSSCCSQNYQGWKDSYIAKHKAMAAIFSDRFRGSFEELSSARYLDALDILTELKVGFEDICLLFRSKLSVLLNLISLHYAFVSLKVSNKDLIDALARHRVGQRQVTVQWCFHDMNNDWLTYSPRQNYALTLSLSEIANGEDAIFHLLHHGTSWEVQRLIIWPAK